MDPSVPSNHADTTAADSQVSAGEPAEGSDDAHVTGVETALRGELESAQAALGADLAALRARLDDLERRLAGQPGRPAGNSGAKGGGKTGAKRAAAGAIGVKGGKRGKGGKSGKKRNAVAGEARSGRASTTASGLRGSTRGLKRPPQRPL
jgi:hypothetical protein